MAALILPSRRVVQPQDPIEVDWGNPITQGLVFGFESGIGDAQARDYVRKQAATLGSGVTKGYGPGQHQINFSGSQGAGSCSFPSNNYLTGASSITVEVWIRPNAIQGKPLSQWADANRLFLLETSASGIVIGLDAGNGGGSVTAFRTASGKVVTGALQQLVWVWRGGAVSNSTVYVNGVDAGALTNVTGSYAPATLNDSSTPITVGFADAGSAINGGVVRGRIWRRGLSYGEVLSLRDNPLQTLRPIQRRILAMVAAGGGVTGSLAATEADSDTFASSGTVLVSGSIAVTESGADTFASTGTVTVAGSLNATESGADTFAATGSTTGGITGSLSATEVGADTAALSGVVLVAGSLNATESGADTFAASGVVVVTGLLSATEAGQDTFAAVGFGGAITGSLNAQESGSDTFFATNVEQQTGGKGFEIVDMPSRQWWKRKPKAIPEQVAEQRVKRVVRAIQEVTQEQAAEPAKATQSAAQQQREVYEAIAPMLAEMPGFDWKQVFRQIVEQDNARRQMQAAIARARFIEQDDEDVLILMF